MISISTKRFRSGLAALLLATVQVLMPTQYALAWTTDPNQDPNIYSKSLICKLTGTPGVNEILQTGNNPVSRDRKPGDQVNTIFNDGQYNSYIIGFARPGEKPEPALSDCYKVVTPEVTVASVCTLSNTSTGSVAITVTNNDIVTGNALTYSITLGGSTQSTSALADGQSQTITFKNLPAGSYSYSVSTLGNVVYSGTAAVSACIVASPTVTATPTACSLLTSNTGTAAFTTANTDDESDQTVTYNYSVSFNGTTITTGSVTLTDGATSAPINLSGLDNGVYTVTINGSDGTSANTSFTIADCSPAVAPYPVSTVTGVCGIDNDIITLAGNTSQYYAVTTAPVFTDGVATITWHTTSADVVFANGTDTYTETFAEVNTADCPAVIPVAPTQTVVCGPNNDIIGTLSYDHATISSVDVSTWSNNNLVITYHAATGYSFYTTDAQGNVVESDSYTVTLVDANTPCPAPTFTEPTCTSSASVTLPKISIGYYYTVSVDNGTATTYTPTLADQILPLIGTPHVVVTLYHQTPRAGVQVASWEHTFTAPSCPVDIPAPLAVDPCGADNAVWATLSAQPQDPHYTWSVVDGHLIATTVGFYTFPNGKTSHDFGVVKDSNVLCPPAAPTISPICGVAPNDEITLPETDHVTYEVTGYDMATGRYTIVATADEGYSFGANEDGSPIMTISWSLDESFTSCELAAINWKRPTCLVTNGSVSVNYDTDRYTYTISKDGGEESYLASSQTTLTPGSYTIRVYEVWYVDEETGQPIYWKKPAATYQQTLSLANGCGGVTTPPVTILPAELPHTGPSDGVNPKGLFLALVAAVATYGGVYFAQRRYSQE